MQTSMVLEEQWQKWALIGLGIGLVVRGLLLALQKGNCNSHFALYSRVFMLCPGLFKIARFDCN